MYTIEAAYFKADDLGVMFFDDDNNGIGFVPLVSLDVVKVAPQGSQSPEDLELVKRMQHIQAQAAALGAVGGKNG